MPVGLLKQCRALQPAHNWWGPFRYLFYFLLMLRAKLARKNLLELVSLLFVIVFLSVVSKQRARERKQTNPGCR